MRTNRARIAFSCAVLASFLFVAYSTLRYMTFGWDE